MRRFPVDGFEHRGVGLPLRTDYPEMAACFCISRGHDISIDAAEIDLGSLFAMETSHAFFTDIYVTWVEFCNVVLRVSSSKHST